VDFFANGVPLASQVFSTTSFSLEVMENSASHESPTYVRKTTWSSSYITPKKALVKYFFSDFSRFF